MSEAPEFREAPKDDEREGVKPTGFGRFLRGWTLLGSPLPLAGSRRAKLALRGRGWGFHGEISLVATPPPTLPRQGGGGKTFKTSTAGSRRSRRSPSPSSPFPGRGRWRGW